MFCTTLETEGEVVRVHVKLVKSPSNSLLTVQRRYFCCGSLLPVFVPEFRRRLPYVCSNYLKFGLGR